MIKKLNKYFLRLQNNMRLSDKTFKSKNFTCICGEVFDDFCVDVDTELECKSCGALITFQPTEWKVCIEKQLLKNYIDKL